MYRPGMMISSVRIHFPASEAQAQSLLRLQVVFAEACNALAPLVREHRCWNRVALHHLAYRQMREAFPGLGSQMICNAIYSVSRAARLVYQHPSSPWCIQGAAQRPLPLLRFSETAPVYFDRHTLSLRRGGVSMYTLDGRMLFEIELSPELEARFRNEKIREIILSRDVEGFFLCFTFADGEAAEASPVFPEYVVAISPEQASA